MNPECFYLKIESEQRGPYTVAQIDHLINSGLVPEDTNYWREGMEDWLPVTNLVRVRRPKNRWMKRALLAGFIVVLVLTARFLGPTVMEGWRESLRYDEFSQRAAYWSARDVVRREAMPAGAAISFGSFKMATITMTETPQRASVWLPAEVSSLQGGSRAVAWDVELAFDAKGKQWSSVSVKEAVPK